MPNQVLLTDQTNRQPIDRTKFGKPGHVPFQPKTIALLETDVSAPAVLQVELYELLQQMAPGRRLAGLRGWQEVLDAGRTPGLPGLLESIQCRAELAWSFRR